MGGCFNNPIVDFVSDVVSYVSDLFCSHSSCGYTPGPSLTDVHARNIAEEFAEMKEQYRNSAEKAEKRVLDYITSSMDSFLNELSKINHKKYGDKELNLNIESIKKKNAKLKNKVVGHISRYIEDRIVQTDPELSVILEEYNDKKREKNFRKFCDDIYAQALNSLKTPIKKCVQEQQSVLESEINQRLKEVSSSAEKKLNVLKEIKVQKEKGNFECEETKLKCMYKVGIMQCIIDEIDSNRNYN